MLAAAVFWTWLWGPIGLLLATQVNWHIPFFVLAALSLLILIVWGSVGAAAGPMRFLSPPIGALYAFGAKVWPAAFHGEPWRLITANYLHGGLLHLLFNCYTLANLGPLIEESFGSRKFFTIYTSQYPISTR